MTTDTATTPAVWTVPATEPVPVEWMRAVREMFRERRQPTGVRLDVLWALALRMGPDGTGSASLRQVAEDAGGVSGSAVSVTTDWAERVGLLSRTWQGNPGRAVPADWTLRMPKPRQAPPAGLDPRTI
jgi:hypothetical protein